MLLRGGAQPGKPSIGLGVVGPLALTDGIECEYNVTEVNESLAAALVESVAFSVDAVAHLKENAGIRWRTTLGQVEIGGDKEARAALVDDLLDAVLATL